MLGRRGRKNLRRNGDTRDPPVHAMTSPIPIDADLTAVGRALGAPLGCAEDGAEAHLAYLDEHGVLVADAVVVRDGRVRRVRRVRRAPPSIHAYWFGKQLAAVAASFGGLALAAAGPALARHESARWTVWTHADRIVRAAHKGLTAAS